MHLILLNILKVDDNLATRQIYFQNGVNMTVAAYGNNTNRYLIYLYNVPDAINDVVFWGMQGNSGSSIIRLNDYWQYFGQTGK